MATQLPSLESIISALVVNCQLPPSEKDKKARSLGFSSKKAWLDACADNAILNLGLLEIKDDLSSRTEWHFRQDVLRCPELSEGKKNTLHGLVPYSPQRRKMDKFKK